VNQQTGETQVVVGIENRGFVRHIRIGVLLLELSAVAMLASIGLWTVRNLRPDSEARRTKASPRFREE
jgi:hypothetical protein